MTQTVNFKDVFRSELGAIRDRHNKLGATKIKQDNAATDPTTALELTGITCSGGVADIPSTRRSITTSGFSNVPHPAMQATAMVSHFTMCLSVPALAGSGSS